MTFKYKKVTYKNKHYAVIETNFNNIPIPHIIDWKHLRTIKNLDKKWTVHNNGFISCKHHYDGKLRQVYLHEIIISLKHKKEKDSFKNVPIIHINRVGLDNRESNIKYQENTKINYKKKKRTIKLPKEANIDPDEIPTYIWYMKENGSHGCRFSVEVGDIKWKTTSSKKVSIKYKLEEAKKYLRNLKKNNPLLFDTNCMNGEFTYEGKNRLKEFYEIIHKIGYEYISEETTNNLTDKFLKKSKLKNITEKKLLNTFDIKKKKWKKKINK